MNLAEILLALGNTNDSELPISALEAAKTNWPEFYPELEQIIEQFIADDTSLTEEQQGILFFGTLLVAELKYSPALAKCLQLFSRSDTFLTPIEAVFADALTELTPSVFYNVADGRTQALSDYIIDGHQAMYCKASAIEAVFAQYEVGVIDKTELTGHVTHWLAAFLALPSCINRFLLSALADVCITYQLDDFKAQFMELCDKGFGDNSLFDEDRFSHNEIKAWDSVDARKLVESGTIETEFNVADTLKAWADDDLTDQALENMLNDDHDAFDSLMAEGGLLSNILYDENTILEHSVPVSSLAATGRNDPCPCGSGKKYKKCCLQ